MTARVEALEAEAFRVQRQQQQVADRLEHVGERLDHLTGAVGELSQQGRATALDIRELNGKVDRLHADVAAGFTAMREGFAALTARLDALAGHTE